MDVADFGMGLADARWLHAKHVVRVHCPIDWPEGRRFLNCGNNFPCPVYLWAYDVLTSADRSEDQILTLDTRTGPWS